MGTLLKAGHKDMGSERGLESRGMSMGGDPSPAVSRCCPVLCPQRSS